MKGFQLGLEPRFDYEDFLANGASYFKTCRPAGSSESRLWRKLIETPEDGVATISDEFCNVYDRRGPGQTNFKA